jgi:hypothetical protein
MEEWIAKREIYRSYKVLGNVSTECCRYSHTNILDKSEEKYQNVSVGDEVFALHVHAMKP